jgi:hypothetical protein
VKNHPGEECSGEEFSASGEFFFRAKNFLVNNYPAKNHPAKNFPSEEIS